MKIFTVRFWYGFFVLLAILCLVGSAFIWVNKSEGAEITWYPVNEVVISWGEVTKLKNGELIPQGDVVKYMVYVAEFDKKEEYIELGETENTQYTIMIPSEGSWLAGVSAVRYRYIDDVLTKLKMSIISWSDVPEYTDDNPFGVVFYFAPLNPLGLKKGGS